MAEHQATLVLDGLIQLPVEVAEALSQHQGKTLSLEWDRAQQAVLARESFSAQNDAPNESLAAGHAPH